MRTDLDAARRRFLTAGVAVVGGVAAAGMAAPLVAAWQPSERARAIGAPVEVDISKLEPGQMLLQSRFDYAGRVYSGVPAPTNLMVPPHKYLSDSRILIGADEESA